MTAATTTDASTVRPRREMVFQDGTSHKFWQIELAGSSHTVTFGKVGTNGQTQTKDFGTDDEAAKSYDKLVAEKLKKGYAESNPPVAGAVTGTVTISAPKPAATAPKAVKSSTSTPVVKSATNSSAGVQEDTHRTNSPSTTAGTTAVPSISANLSINRELRLPAEDLARATYLAKPLQRSEAVPFHLDQCAARLAKLKTEAYGWGIRWGDLNLASGLDPKEAHFWLEAMTLNRDRNDTPATIAKDLTKLRFTGELSANQVRELIQRQGRDVPEEIGIVLGNLLLPTEVMEVWKGYSAAQYSNVELSLSNGIIRFVIPYWTEAERKIVVDLVRKDWDSTQVPATFYSPFPQEYYLAAALGMRSEVASVVSSLPPNHYTKDDWTDHYQRPQQLVFGLGSPEEIASEWRRLHLKMRSPNHARVFLACTQYSALDCVRDSILAETKKERCEELLKVFAFVIAPEAAPYMLECKLTSRSPAIARQWLDDNVGCAIAGLIETANGRGKLADAAIEYLRSAKRLGFQSLIEECVRAANPESVERVRHDVIESHDRIYTAFDDGSTPEWLQQALNEAAKLKKHKLPTWASPATTPPLCVGDSRLNDNQVAVVLNTLAATVTSGSHTLFDVLHEHADAKSLDEFAWRLFQLWLEDGGPSKEKWAMGAIGLLGGDNCALKLTPLVRNWPGESQHQRAVFGLECLRAIGSNVALMQLSGIAQKLKFKGLKTKAEQCVEAIAKDKGLTRAELEDRIIPDCGLDENGKRDFPFGPRTFSFLLGLELKPMVRDGDGKVRDDLPKPGAKDDASIAETSVAEWKLLKKQIKEVAKIQAGRMEQAMVTGRRWKIDEFEMLLVKHPLMTHLVRKILWGAYDASGTLATIFRVTDERDYADAEENSVSLQDAVSVGIVHPLNLANDIRSTWGEVLSDYEIVPPFPQLGRPVYTLEPAEKGSDNLTRFKGMKLVAPTLVFGFEKLGWIRGVGMDGGGFDEHSKQFPAAGITAVARYEGNVAMGWIDPDEILEITDCQFVSGMRAPSGYGFDTKDKLLKLADVDPIVISEVIADLNEFRSKAK